MCPKLTCIQSLLLVQNSYVATGDDAKDIEVNFGMHKNMIEGLEAAATR